MKSRLIQKDHEELVNIVRNMPREERLEAFRRHSRSVIQIYEAGRSFRERICRSPSDPSRTTHEN